MIILNTKTNKDMEIELKEFKVLFSNELDFTLEKFSENNMQDYLWEPESSPTYNEQKSIDDYVTELNSRFYKKLKDNFNEYSEQWSSPRGNEPIYEIIEW